MMPWLPQWSSLGSLRTARKPVQGEACRRRPCTETRPRPVLAQSGPCAAGAAVCFNQPRGFRRARRRKMKQAAEYREHAAECLKLANTARNEAERQQLMQMAEAWERMAAERERRIRADSNLGKRDVSK